MPAASIHRLIRTLVTLGYVRQEPSRRYGLAVGLIRLGDGAAKRLGTWARPVLAGLVERIGETANLAILEGSHALYVAQAPGRHSMRMFTEVGARVHLHSTAVGKALLAQLTDDEASKILELSGMPALTDHTITDPEVLRHESSGDSGTGLRHRRGGAGDRRVMCRRASSGSTRPDRNLVLGSRSPLDA